MPKSEPEFEFRKPGAIRVRFAPSPTGNLHIGSARTGLFNFLFARKNQGILILRLEDTDKERSKPEFEKDIIDSLKALGIEWDEGPDIEADFGPYRQSKRTEIYKKYLNQLLTEKKAYHCFCSQEDLEAQKQYFLSIGQAPIYNGKCSNLTEKEVKKNLKEKKDFVIRFKVPKKKIIFKDLIRGEVEFDTDLIGDFVISKGQDFALYNFACAVDDFEMKISHVIRGEDHVSNTPKQILLQEALGFPTPEYAHLPLILAPDRTKLSKRHGAIALSDFLNKGYLSEALVNFIAFLGWNPGIEREIYSLASLIKEFSLERVKKGGAVFNIKRLDFLNGFYIRQKPIESLTKECIPFLVKEKLIKEKGDDEKAEFGSEGPEFKIIETKQEIEFEALQKIVSIYKERLKKLSELPKLVDFFFKERLEYNKELLKWKSQSDENIIASIDKLTGVLSNIEDDNWTKEKLEEILAKEAEAFSAQAGGRIGDRGYLLWPLRVALTGKKASATPFEIAEILGKEKVLKRLEQAKELI